MDDQIVSRDMIRECAREDFAKGLGRDEHNMNPGAAAIADWQDEWDRCNARLRHMQVEVSPP